MMTFRVGAEQQLHADKVLQIYGRARKTREEVLSWVVYSLERRGRQVIRLESAKAQKLEKTESTHPLFHYSVNCTLQTQDCSQSMFPLFHAMSVPDQDS